MTDSERTPAPESPAREAPIPPAPATGMPAAPGVGAMLARARAAAGLSIDECAQQLKFPARRLQALEEERYDELPAGTYARGMLRAYARLLQLDADALVQLSSSRIEVRDTSDTAVSLRPPIPFSEAGRRSNVLYAGLSLVALAVVAWVAYGWFQDRGAPTKVTFSSAGRGPAAGDAPSGREAVPLEAAKATIIAAGSPPAAPAPQEPKPSAASPAPQPPVAQIPPPVVSAPAPAAAPTTPAPPPVPPVAPASAATPAPATSAAAEAAPGPVADGKRRMVLTFEREAWVEVRSLSTRRVVATFMGVPGSRRAIDGEPPLVVVIGNASFVQLSYDDRPVPLRPHTKSDVAKVTLQ